MAISGTAAGFCQHDTGRWRLSWRTHVLRDDNIEASPDDLLVVPLDVSHAVPLDDRRRPFKWILCPLLANRAVTDRRTEVTPAEMLKVLPVVPVEVHWPCLCLFASKDAGRHQSVLSNAKVCVFNPVEAMSVVCGQSPSRFHWQKTITLGGSLPERGCFTVCRT